MMFLLLLALTGALSRRNKSLRSGRVLKAVCKGRQRHSRL